MTKLFQPSAVISRQLFTRNPDELPRRHIEQRDAACWQIIELLNPTIDLEHAAEFAQALRERVRN